MGIPKFFRFISERYPCISEPIYKDTYVHEFDNLYLDMNGIIHICSHPDDNNIHFRIDEEKIYKDIFHYISYLFQLIKPKKVFFMAIDGVAPRAKMNQQRSRRFQSAREAEESLQKAIEKNEILPNTKRFDSNCITPGTVFMARLHEQLRYFIQTQISTNRSWAQCKIILSGHETPGEGEHKIMDYIRYIRTKPDHDPNTRHCLYGQDADLIMLGFCTHEPNFSILREEVIFKKNHARPGTPNEINFYLLHLSLLRDYIEQEFLILKNQLPFPFDIYKIIDDWVLLGFLIGNDFIPNLPNLIINKNVLPKLYDIYKKVLPTLDGYINESGKLNLARFEVYMTNLAELDKNNFQEMYGNLKYLESKTGKRSNKNGIMDDFETFDTSTDQQSDNKSGFKSDLEKLIASTNELELDDEFMWTSDDEQRDEDSGDEMFDAEFLLHKRDYYINKMEYESVTEDVLKSQAEGYIKAIQWILNYYYQGCCSWSWYYPHHYAPYLSDVNNFKNMEIVFEKGTPFKPFEQLLAVLPVASKELLPEAFHELMTSESSPIIHYYPLNFETDLNGKMQQWEAVVLLPFIDEKKLLSAMETCYDNITEEEKKRNTHGPMLIYSYTENSLGEIVAPAYFPTINVSHAIETRVWVEDMIVPIDKVVRGTLPNPYINTFFPGIPTLKHLEFSSELMNAKVKIFEYPSRNDSLILRVNSSKNNQSLELVAADLLGKIIWVGWPYIVEAKVVAVSNMDYKITYIGSGDNGCLEDEKVMSVIKNESTSSKVQFLSEKRNITDHYMTRLGIDAGIINIMVHAVLIQGYKYIPTNDGKLVCGVQWSKVPVFYPLQTILKFVEISPDVASKPYQTIEQGFPEGGNAFIIMGPYYGCMAKILDKNEISKSGRLLLELIQESEPRLRIPRVKAIDQYVIGRIAAMKCQISSFLFSRITSSLFVVPVVKSDSKKQDKNVNIGLNLKSVKSNTELLGYTRKDNNWLYSMRCIDLVSNYVHTFYSMFIKLESMMDNNKDFSEQDLFEEDGPYGLSDVVKWLSSQPYIKSMSLPCGTDTLDPIEMEEIRTSIECQPQDKKKIVIKLKPYILFREELRKGNLPPDLSVTTFQLFDRVVNISSSCSVPLGYKGTIVSIITKPNQNATKFSDNVLVNPMYMVQFDKEFDNGLTINGCEGRRFYLMHGFNMLNMTAGLKDYKNNEKIKIENKTQLNNGDKIDSKSSISNITLKNNYNSAFAQYTASPKKVQQQTPEFKPPNISPQINSFSCIPANFLPANESLSQAIQNVQLKQAKIFHPPSNPPMIPPMKQVNPPMIPHMNHVNPPMIPPMKHVNPPMIPPMKHVNPPMNPPMIPLMNHINPPVNTINVNPQLFNYGNIYPPQVQQQQVHQFPSHLQPQQVRHQPPPPPQFLQYHQTPPKVIDNMQGTQALKSLLGINNTPTSHHNNLNNVQISPQQMNNSGQYIASQEFYKSPPSNMQLPFPNKLINESNQVPKVMVRPDLVPSQVVKNIRNNVQEQPVKVVNNDVGLVVNNLLTPIVAHPISDNQDGSKSQVQKPVKRQRQKSRIMANFNNMKQ